MEGMKYPMVMSEYDRFWVRYCGFLDLSLQEFMTIQQSLLLQQLQEVSRCPLGRRLIGNNIPASVDDFRESVPLTTYEDYLPELEQRDEDSLCEKPYIWAHTSSSPAYKQVPYTPQFYDETLDNLMAVFILSCSKRKGQSSIVKDDRVLFNVAPSPYMSGILAHGASERFDLRPVISPDLHDDMDFKEKLAKGFEVSLQTGVDILIAMTSVLVKMGNEFNSHSRKTKLSKHLLNPKVVYRYGRAMLQSKLEKRSLLPKDLWRVKAVIGWGMDTSIYRDLVHKYWGKYPYEFYACTEAGIMALQSWNKRDLTFIPHSNFFEFIPETELLGKKNNFHQPRTVLLSEVKPGERYELVITSFHRMPFIRYRLGHLIKITSLEDKEAQICLPQMVFEARADDLIDIAGFTRISEKTVIQAIANSGLSFEEWSIRKEVKQGKPTLHLYTELGNNKHNPAEVASILHQELKNVDCFYNDLSSMMDICPLRVTLLRHGTFRDYYEEKKKAGAELSQRKPPRMNAPEAAIRELLYLGNKTGQKYEVASKV